MVQRRWHSPEQAPRAKNLRSVSRNAKCPIRAALGAAIRTIAAIIAIGQGNGALAQSQGSATPPPSAPQVDQSQRSDDIVVIAPSSEQRSIDRTTYTVRDTAEARSSSTFDLIGHIPTVQVMPSGAIRLMGKSGVVILIDGNEVASPVEFLRNLQGSQVARIEIITNPSAQFSAHGTAGIINIITRRSFKSGLGGSLTAGGGSFGTYDLKASPSWSRNGLSLTASLGIARNIGRSDYDRGRRLVGAGDDTILDSTEEGEIRSEHNIRSGNLLATVQLAPKQTLTLTAFAVNLDGETSREAEIQLFEPSQIFSQSAAGSVDSKVRSLSAEYRREGKREGEELTISASRFVSRFRAESLYATDDGSGELADFGIRSNDSANDTVFKFDYVRPSGKKRLSAGGVIQRTHNDNQTRWDGDLLTGDFIAMESSIQGSWLEKAVYISHQFPLLGGTVLAGLRVEDRNYDIVDAPLDRSPGGTHVFPTLHLERDISKRVKVQLSYSRRIAWPRITDLDPRLRFVDPTTASAGNPALQPEITDSFEGKLQAQVGKHSVDLTSYYNKTRDLFSSLVELEDEVLISRPINLGTRVSLGANLSVSGPIVKGLRYVATGDLAHENIKNGDEAFNLDDAGARYGASFQLDYRDGIEGKRGADHITVRTRYSGPTDLGLVKVSSFVSVNASWSHVFTDRISTAMSVSDVIGPPTIHTTTFSSGVISRQSDRAAGPRFTFSLTYSLKRSQQ